MLALLLFFGCLRPAGAPRPMPLHKPMIFGWRLVPGETLRFAHSSTFDMGDEQRQREEHWEYLVRSVDEDGVALLEGHLTGLGAQLERSGEALPPPTLDAARLEETERLKAATVTLELAMDGRLVSLEGLPWSDSLTHRLLALRLPPDAVEPGDLWPDPVLARPYADLVPMDLDLTVEGEQRFDGFFARDSKPQAHILGVGAVRVDQGPTLRLQGESWWDPHSGRLQERSLTVVLEEEQERTGSLQLGVRVLGN